MQYNQEANNLQYDDPMSSLLGLGFLFLAGYGLYKLFNSNSNPEAERWKMLSRREREILSHLSGEDF